MKKINKLITLSFITTFLVSPLSTFALTKTENVYSTLNYDGSFKSTIVNNKISNLDKGDVVDYTKLDDIVNINGREKFSRESDKITWKSTGKDIVYQGKLNEELPIKISVKYYLNDKEVNPKDIKGKSGSIRIEYKFSNTSYDNNSGMYTPFVVTMVNIIDNDNNSNINVTNGKVITNGKKSIITSIAAPGLYDSVNLNELKSMDSITVCYDTSKFIMSDTYFVTTPKLLDGVDVSKLNEVSKLKNSLYTLQDGMNKLENGSDSLSDGAKELDNGAKELNKGLESAYNGSSALNDGAIELDNGLNSLNEGIKNALDGSNTITNGLNQINGASSKFSSLTVLVDQLYSTYNDNNVLLNNIMNGTTEQQLRDGISEATLAKTDLENKLNEINAGIAMLEVNIDYLNDEQKAQLNSLKESKVQVEDGIKMYSNGISDALNNLNSLAYAPAKISGANEVISKVLCGILGVNSMDEVNDDTINNFKVQINTLLGGISQLSEGSSNLTNGLNQIYQGSQLLSAGSNKLSDGTNDLNNGLEKLYKGSTSLEEGTLKLSNGSIELRDGICKINKEGINKLTSYGNKLSNYSNSVEELVNLSKNYKGFASNNSDEVIFIYKLSK